MIHSLNGTLVPADDSRLDPRDRGFTLGDGLFETIAVVHGEARWLDRHLNRLRDGLGRLGIVDAPTDSALTAAVRDVIVANDLADGVLRLSISRGPGGRGLDTGEAGPPTTLIVPSATRPRIDAVGAVVSSEVRRNERSPSAGLKSLSYLDNVLARQEARRRGAEEALLLNTRDRIAESTIANVVAVSGGYAVTPPLDDGPLPGVARGILVDEGLVRVGSLSLDDVKRADAVILTNSLAIRRLARLDDTAFDDDAEAVLGRFRTALAAA